MNIAIIGAGLGGLASASLLASDGHQVTVFEKNSAAGGKMGEVKAEGFRFDTGPSLLTMPELLEQVFRQSGADLNDYLELIPLEPLCRYFYGDGTVLDSYHEIQKALDEIEQIAPGDVEAYTAFLDYSKKLYDNTYSSFLANPLFNLSDLKNVDITDFLQIDAFSTVSERVDSYFESPYLRQMFKRFTTYNGSSPFQAPSTLNVIPHVEISRGGYYVSGGIHRISEALEKLARKAGAEFRFETEVSAITVDNGRTTGIRLTDGQQIACDVVLSNSDARETYMNLLPDSEVSALRKTSISETEPSCSGFVLLLGVNRRYEMLRHHNVFFSGDYEQEFESIFKTHLPTEDPTIYVANTSFTDLDHAPESGSNLFVLVNAPYLTDKIDWEEKKRAYANNIKQKLEDRGLKSLRNSIQFEQIITPLDFHKKYRSNRGSIYGTSSNSRLSAFMRPGNKARRPEGLYLSGGSTHPGGGIPLVLLSAMHACELIERSD